ncbi:hypothetical protein CC79DRAFT_1377471 [Sarocladium strictum]
MIWVSSTSRITLIGDAAHPHLPTSGQGAAEAFEDAATIGALVDKLGVDGIPTAFRAFEKLRFERISLTQRMGWETQHRCHQMDWDMVASNPEFLKMAQPLWLYDFDAEQYTYDRVCHGRPLLHGPKVGRFLAESVSSATLVIFSLMPLSGRRLGPLLCGSTGPVFSKLNFLMSSVMTTLNSSSANDLPIQILGPVEKA